MTVDFPETLTPLAAAAALEKLRANEVLRHYHIVGELDLLKLSADNTYCLHPIQLEHCRVDSLSGVVLSYERPVVLRHCHFHRAAFTFAYFIQGLRIEDCVFDNYLDFQAGGHNKPGFLVLLLRNVFKKFVNFFDCWYEAEVQIEENNFQGETNLLGTPHNIPATFDVPPLIQHNIGNLYRSDEAERPT